MKYDVKKRERLADKLDPITPKEMSEDGEWLPVAETAKREGVTVQAILNRINTGKCEARSAWGVFIVVKQGTFGF